MWPFKTTKTLLDQGIFNNFTDTHSHILPGVDDGVKTLDESLRILQTYEQLGMKAVWLTPHIQEYLPNETAFLRSEFSKLQNSYKGSIQLHLSAEYMLDNLFLQRLETGDLLLHSLPGEKPALLVETSYLNPPMNLWGLLQKIKSRDIQPILAHPERYLYMHQDDYDRLHDQGIQLQLNLPSLLGYYGHQVQQRAEKLQKQGYITHYGTDIHTDTLLPLLRTRKLPLLS